VKLEGKKETDAQAQKGGSEAEETSRGRRKRKFLPQN
jgi:hypothetical protein